MILYDYETSSGRNVIKEYIDSLTIPEMVDGYSVREKMENGEFRSGKALCGRPTAAPAVTQGADGLQAVRRGRTLRYHPLSNKTRRCRP